MPYNLISTGGDFYVDNGTSSPILFSKQSVTRKDFEKVGFVRLHVTQAGKQETILEYPLAEFQVNGVDAHNIDDAVAGLATVFLDALATALKGPINLTKAQADDLLAGDGAVAGQLYNITDFAPFIGPTGVLLTGSTNPKKFLPNGFAKFLVPNFAEDSEFTALLYKVTISAFTHGSSFSDGETAHTENTTGKIFKFISNGFGGGVVYYQVLTGDISGDVVLTSDFVGIGGANSANIDAPDDILIDGQNGIWNLALEGDLVEYNTVIWNNFIYLVIDVDSFAGLNPSETPLAYIQLPKSTDFGYKEDEDIIVIDWENNHIVNRVDKYNNSIGADFGAIGGVLGGNYPIKHFQWGNAAAKNNTMFNQFIDWKNYIPQTNQDYLINYGSPYSYPKYVDMSGGNYELIQMDNNKTLYLSLGSDNENIFYPNGLVLPFEVKCRDNAENDGRPIVTSSGIRQNRQDFFKSAGYKGVFAIIGENTDGDCTVVGDLQAE